MKRLALLLVCGSCLALVACSRSEGERPVVVAVDTTLLESAPDVDSVPLVRETISIEGMRETIPARRFQPPLGFPMGFTTVVPADLEVVFASSGEGDVIRFEAAFGGVRNPSVSLVFNVLPQATDAAAARVQAGVRSGFAPRTEGWPWGLEEYASTEGPGFLALGERGGRWFYFLARYPPEYGDGMGPRIDLILRRWTWSDGAPLLTAEKENAEGL